MALPARALRPSSLLLALLALAFSACVEPDSVLCPSGLVCPEGQRCAARQEDACIKDSCGDDVLQAGETCDDGNILDGDGCSRDCKSQETCGNGTVDLSMKEVCDDGNVVDADGCSADCMSNELCTNKVVDSAVGEKCDDGNSDNGDGCSADCLSAEFCGNGYIDVVKGEVCDDGNSDSGDGCSADCRSKETCGNGILDMAVGEVCDDGNPVSGDGCRADCRSAELCGDRLVDVHVGEVCDDGNQESGDKCSADCRSGETCHNNVRDLGEECDDGNESNEDACIDLGAGKQCIKATCGDGHVYKDVEQCDTSGESSSCDRDCTKPLCGDRILNPAAGEVCDDGNVASGDGCSADCRSKETCGNGILDAGEVCERNDPLCTADCRSSGVCGNGIRDPNEECDDGNPNGSDWCVACKLAVCGDGEQRVSWSLSRPAEACDDGNTDSCGTCNASCSRTQSSARASGKVVAIAERDLRDGESFIVKVTDDEQFVFEFNKDNSDVGEHISVPLSSTTQRDAKRVAVIIKDTITNLPDLPFEANIVLGHEEVVILTPKVMGSAGNYQLSKTVKDKGFKVESMMGGRGHDCPAGTGCKKDADCESGLRCLPIGTCG